MNDSEQNTGFSPEQFLDDLIAEIGLSEVPADELEELKQAMQTQMDHVIMTAVSIYLEPETIDYVFTKHAEIADSDLLFAELVTNSPKSQIAILEALEQFRQDTLDAHKTLVKAG